MADQFNDSIPLVTNQITEDVADIAESLGYLKDCFQKLVGATWSNTDTTGFKLATAPGFNDTTYNITFPTNGMAAAKFMLGDSNTIAWFYNNTAPPGWKIYSYGGDAVLAVAGGAADYNVNGGAASSNQTWGIAGLTANAHTHTGPSHTHTGTTTDSYNFTAATVTAGSGANSQIMGHTHPFTTDADGTGASGAANVNGVTAAGTWRVPASVGKLYQLDTA
jgi:hypothetical protein